MLRLGLLLILLVAPTFARAEGTWSVVPRGNGSAAVYEVGGKPLFLVHCSADRSRLVVNYFGDDALAARANPEIELLGRSHLRLTTRLSDGLQIGEFPRGRVLDTALETESLEIVTANELVVPWHVGSAGPLRTVAERC
jgi:hypothetical protein